MVRAAVTHPRNALGVALLAMLAGCASTSDAVESRPSLGPSSGAGYADFVRDQEREIRSGPSAETSERLGERVDLRSVLGTALERNPRILRSRSQWKAAVERVPQATALPDPTLMVLHYVESVETRVGPMENGITLAQKIPFPSKLVQAGNVAEEGARIAALGYSAAVRDVLVEVKTAYYEYVYLTRARALVEENLSIARRLAGLGEELYTEDKALLIDVLKAQSQLAQLEYDLITLGELISAEKTRLNSLMDRPPEAPLGYAEAAPFPRLELTAEDLFTIAARNREELRMADHAIERAKAKEALAESQYAPDLTIGGTYVDIGRSRSAMAPAEDNGKDAYGVIVGVSIPIWANRTSAGVREARAAREAAVRGKAEAWNRTFTALKDAFFKLTNAERLVLLYRDSLIPQAKQVMLSTEELSREDRLRLGDYLEAQTVWLNFTLAMERALADYNQSIARLERLTGTTVVPVVEEDGR